MRIKGKARAHIPPANALKSSIGAAWPPGRRGLRGQLRSSPGTRAQAKAAQTQAGDHDLAVAGLDPGFQNLIHTGVKRAAAPSATAVVAAAAAAVAAAAAASGEAAAAAAAEAPSPRRG